MGCARLPFSYVDDHLDEASETHDCVTVLFEANFERIDKGIDKDAASLRRDGKEVLEPPQIVGHLHLGLQGTEPTSDQPSVLLGVR